MSWKGWLGSGVAVLVVAAALAFAVVWPLHVWRHELHYPYDKWGAWIQGILTPMIVFGAIAAWVGQVKASRQKDEFNQSVLLSSNLHEIYGHLNYSAACAITGGRPDFATVPRGNLQCVDRLARILGGKDPTEEDRKSGAALPAMSREEIVKGEYFKALHESLEGVAGILERANIRFMIDQRVRGLRERVRTAV